MCYSIEPRDRIYTKGYRFLSFPKNIGKNLSNKYSQKLLDSTKKSTADVIKTASNKPIQKTAKATGDLIGDKISDKIASISKKPSQNNLEAVKRIIFFLKKKIYTSRKKTSNYS